MFGTVRCLVYSRETDLRNVTWIAFFSETQRCTHLKFCKQAPFKFIYRANGFKNEFERVTLSSSPTLSRSWPASSELLRYLMAPVDICILAHIGSSESLHFEFLQSKDPPIKILKLYSLLVMVKPRGHKEKVGLELPLAICQYIYGHKSVFF